MTLGRYSSTAASSASGSSPSSSPGTDTTRACASTNRCNGMTYVGRSTSTASPGSSSTLQSRSSAWVAPVVTTISLGPGGNPDRRHPLDDRRPQPRAALREPVLECRWRVAVREPGGERRADPRDVEPRGFMNPAPNDIMPGCPRTDWNIRMTGSSSPAVRTAGAGVRIAWSPLVTLPTQSIPRWRGKSAKSA